MSIPPVMVWTMAKVGTASYCNALRGAGIKFWNAHWITGGWPESEFPTSTTGGAAEKVLADNIPATTIITGVREPVARAMSAYIQQRGRYSNPTNYEELYTGLTELFDITYADKWFEHELKGNFGLDIYTKPFNHKRGYQIYVYGRHKIALIRLEDADEVFEDVTEELFGIRIPMITRNVWSYRLKNDSLLTHYERLKGSVLPSAFLDKCYSLKYAQHFYTPDELDMHRWRWEHGPN